MVASCCFTLEGVFLEEYTKKIRFWGNIVYVISTLGMACRWLGILPAAVACIIVVLVLIYSFPVCNELGRLARRNVEVRLIDHGSELVDLIYEIEGLEGTPILLRCYEWDDVDAIRAQMQEWGVPFQARSIKSANKK